MKVKGVREVSEFVDVEVKPSTILDIVLSLLEKKNPLYKRESYITINKDKRFELNTLDFVHPHNGDSVYKVRLATEEEIKVYSFAREIEVLFRS